MEKTIEKTKKPKTETLKRTLNRLAKDTNEKGRIQTISANGKITFTNLNGIVETVDSNTNVLYFNIMTGHFMIGKPIIEMIVSKETYHNYDFDDNYVEETYWNVNIKMHFLVSSDETPYLYQFRTAQYNKIVEKDFANVERLGITNFNSFIKHFFFSKKQYLFIGGKKYTKKNLKELTLDKVRGTVLLNKAGGRVTDYSTSSDIKPTEDTVFNINGLSSQNIICKSIKKNEIINIKDFVSQTVDDNGKYDIALKSFKIANNKVEINTSVSFPTQGQHSDCCGVYLPFKHGGSNNVDIYNTLLTLPKSTRNKIYLMYNLVSKAARVLFLTDNQLKILKAYKLIFGRDNVEIKYTFINPNSSNLIHVVHINSVGRIESVLKQKLRVDESNRVLGGIRTSISNFLAIINYTDMIVNQWFENSEEKKGILKPVKGIRNPNKLSSVRGNPATSVFMAAPVQNYNTR